MERFESASKRKVGTVNEEKPAVVVHCAHDLCEHPAIINIRLDTGWTNLCRFHYEFHHQRKANDFCESKGLETTEQKAEWIRGKGELFLGPKSLPVEQDDGIPF